MLRIRGFTLIEVIIVVLIIGILAAIAIPSYQNHVKKANRANAQSLMMDVASKQTLYLSTARAYAGTLAELQVTPSTDVTKFYDVTLAATAGPPPGFTVTATPKAGTMQATDPVLTLDEKGTKTPSDKW